MDALRITRDDKVRCYAKFNFVALDLENGEKKKVTSDAKLMFVYESCEPCYNTKKLITHPT